MKNEISNSKTPLSYNGNGVATCGRSRKSLFRFLAVGIVMMLFGLTMVVVGTINDYLTTAHHVDKSFIGFCAALLTLGILAGSFVFGSVAERFGYKPVMLAGIFFIVAGLSGVATTENTSLVPYMLMLIGAGGGILNGVTNAIVALLYPVNTGAWLSLLGVFYGVGAFGLPLITSMLLKQGMGYPSILLTMSIIALVPFLLTLFLRFPGPVKSGAVNMRQYLKLFTQPAIIYIGLFLLFQSALETIVPTWTPSYLRDTFPVDYSRALYAITVSCISIAVTRIFLSHLLKKIPSFRVLLFSLIITIAGIVTLETGGSFGAGLAGIALVGMGMAASFPVMLDYAATQNKNHTGVIFSIVIGISLTGSILLNLLTGYLLQFSGIQILNGILIILVLIMIALLCKIHFSIMKKRQ